jgi:hypothetical protein
MEEIDRQFANIPNLNFNICIKVNDLDKVIMENKVVIKCDFDCYCYSDNPRTSEYFICKKEKNITNRDLINCLIENKFDTQCNHCFLEKFEITSECQVKPWFGS